MIKQIANILQTYKTSKGKLDQDWREKEATMKAEFSAERIARVRPEMLQRHTESENTLKVATLAAIEKELSKVEKHVAFMVQNIHPDTLAEITALQGVGLSEYETNLLLQKYTGDYWATAKLVDMLNATRSDLNKIQFTRPEELLQVAAELKRDCAFILNNYTEGGAATPGQDAANIKIALIEKNFGDYADRLTTDYISEPDFDRPAPLTSIEAKTVESFFADCESGMDKRERAAELADQGKGELISRSEYAHYLPKSWEYVPELSPVGKMLLTGSIDPEQYAGLAEVYQNFKPGDVMDLSALTGVAMPETTTEVQADTPQDNAE
jgi:hypothetical protein